MAQGNGNSFLREALLVGEHDALALRSRKQAQATLQGGVPSARLTLLLGSFDTQLLGAGELGHVDQHSGPQRTLQVDIPWRHLLAEETTKS